MTSGSRSTSHLLQSIALALAVTGVWEGACRFFALSAVVAHELYYGAYRGQRTAENLARLDALLFPVLEFDREDARHAGEIRAMLATSVTPIGPFYVLIGGHARARDLILMTRNVREFERTIETW